MGPRNDLRCHVTIFYLFLSFLVIAIWNITISPWLAAAAVAALDAGQTLPTLFNNYSSNEQSYHGEIVSPKMDTHCATKGELTRNVWPKGRT